MTSPIQLVEQIDDFAVNEPAPGAALKSNDLVHVLTQENQKSLDSSPEMSPVKA